jgi:hypothetical protein
MGRMATILLKHRPTDERCEEIASHVAEQLGVPVGSISWVVSEDIPEGYSTHLVDQLSAHRRDTAGEPVYLTVTVTPEKP